MANQVLLTDLARDELEHACTWWAENRSTEQAERWYAGLVAAIQALADNPERCPIADENELFPYEIRQLNFGLGRRPTHRVVIHATV